jgi:hypothetical protein
MVRATALRLVYLTHHFSPCHALAAVSEMNDPGAAYVTSFGSAAALPDACRAARPGPQGAQVTGQLRRLVNLELAAQ